MADVASALPKNMTADAFLTWAAQQSGGRYELHHGEVVAMSPERVAHASVKAEIWLMLRNAIASEGHPCQAYVDGVSVRMDDSTVYEPDALVRCGEPIDEDAVEIADPVIVVEVVSPSTRAIDSGAKLSAYFRLPSVRHYLVVSTKDRRVIHHARSEGETIATRILLGGPLLLEPPGITIQVEDAFAQL